MKLPIASETKFEVWEILNNNSLCLNYKKKILKEKYFSQLKFKQNLKIAAEKSNLVKIDEVFEELLMKMEVLSVQNQFQGHQFGVIGSNKVKDWTSPLTPPPPSHHHHHNHHKSSNNSSADEVDSISRNHNNRNHTNNDNNATNLRINNLVFEDTNQTSSVRNNISESSAFVSNFDTTAINALSLRLQSELRAAKSRHLACTEVLLPSDLLHRVAVEIFKVSEKEPCGLRGCTIFIEFEDEPSNTRRIASLKIDPNTVSTFELYLTLKHDKSGWTSILPQFLKNLARSSTVMISPEFILTKNKLYHSFSE